MASDPVASVSDPPVTVPARGAGKTAFCDAAPPVDVPVPAEGRACSSVCVTSSPPRWARRRQVPSCGVGRCAMKAPLGATGTAVPLISSAACPVPTLP